MPSIMSADAPSVGQPESVFSRRTPLAKTVGMMVLAIFLSRPSAGPLLLSSRTQREKKNYAGEASENHRGIRRSPKNRAALPERWRRLPRIHSHAGQHRVILLRRRWLKPIRDRAEQPRAR